MIARLGTQNVHRFEQLIFHRYRKVYWFIHGKNKIIDFQLPSPCPVIN